MTDNPQNWNDLKALAENGSLSLELDQTAGDQVLKSLGDHLEVLNDAMQQLSRISYVAGFGDCPTGHAMEGRFAMKANGGEDSLAKRLREHIDVTQAMIDTIRAAMKNYHDTDAANSSAVNAVQGQRPS